MPIYNSDRDFLQMHAFSSSVGMHAGKTTTVRILTGVLQLDDGTAVIMG